MPTITQRDFSEELDGFLNKDPEIGGLILMDKRVFLLKHSLQLPLKEPLGEYDPAESLNISFHKGERIPIVSIVGGPPTNSKTMALPGDDDPDPGQEQCY